MKKHLIGLAILGLALVGTALPVQAAFQIRMTSSLGPTVTITDDIVPDAFSPIPGAISWSGSLGGTTLDVVGGFTYPVFGSTTAPELDLSYSVTKISGATESMTIEITQTGFLTSPINLTAAIGGANRGTTTSYEAAYGLTAFDYPPPGGTTGVQGPFSGVSFSTFVDFRVEGPTPYSLSQKVIIAGLEVGDAASGNALITLPEPASMAIWSLIGGIGAVVGLRRSRRKA